MEEIGRGIIHSMWVEHNIQWSCLPATGVAGGILTAWNVDLIRCKNSMLGRVSLSYQFEEIGRGEGVGFHRCILSR